MMKTFGYWAVIFVLIIPCLGIAQISPTSNLINTAPPTPVGSGARSMGTGGAFIAIADDATAANWNPAGLIQLVLPETSIVVTVEERVVDDDAVDFKNINYLSVVYPFTYSIQSPWLAAEDANAVISLNYQRLYDFYFDEKVRDTLYNSTPRPWIFPFDNVLAQQQTDTYFEKHRGFTTIVGDVGAISPAMAIQITPTFAVGFTYNIWRDGIIGRDYEFESETTSGGTYSLRIHDRLDLDGDCTCGGVPCPPGGGGTPDDPNCLEVLLSDTVGNFPIEGFEHYEEEINFKAENWNLGFLWDVTPRFTVGGVYRTEFRASIERSAQLVSGDPPVPEPPFKSDDTMRFPASYGLGLAFRYSDELTFAADITRIEWDRFRLTEEDGDEFSPVNGLPMNDAEIDPTMAYRAGMEYLVIQPQYVVPIRCGFFYDPEPSFEDPDDYYGVAAGTGLVYRNLVLDLSYWYRWGDDVTISTSAVRDRATKEIIDVEEEKGDITRQMLMLSAILHFE